MVTFIFLAAVCLVLVLLLGSVAVTYASTVTVVETLPGNTGSASDTNRKVTHDQYNETASLSSGTTPPATLTANFLATLSSGTLTLNLAALTGTNGATVDGTGLKVQIIRIKNLGANSLTVAEGGSNGYSLFGSSGQITIPAGAHVTYYTNDASPDIASGDRTIDLTGTGAQTSEWSIVMG